MEQIGYSILAALLSELVKALVRWVLASVRAHKETRSDDNNLSHHDG